jgi:hypothetical protein
MDNVWTQRSAIGLVVTVLGGFIVSALDYYMI